MTGSASTAPYSSEPTVEVPAGKLPVGLLSLFRPGPKAQLIPDQPGYMLHRRPDPYSATTEHAVVVGADDHEALWALAHPDAERYCAALLVERRQNPEEFVCEHVLRLVHGPRKPNHSRARQLRLLRALLELLERGRFFLDGSLKENQKSLKKGKTAEHYGGQVNGDPLLHYDRSTHNLQLTAAFEQAIRQGPYTVMPAAHLRLASLHQADGSFGNPEGNWPSRRDKTRYQLWAALCERRWQTRQRFERYVDAAGVNKTRINTTGRWQRHLDTFCDQLKASAERGGVGPAEPIERNSPARHCLVGLSEPSCRPAFSRRRRSTMKTSRPRRSSASRRPLSTTPTGSPVATGPPRAA
jgi:hypothetical protein